MTVHTCRSNDIMPAGTNPVCLECITNTHSNWQPKTAQQKATAARLRRNRLEREKRQVLADLGMKRVRGANGGVYYE